MLWQKPTPLLSHEAKDENNSNGTVVIGLLRNGFQLNPLNVCSDEPTTMFTGNQ